MHGVEDNLFVDWQVVHLCPACGMDMVNFRLSALTIAWWNHDVYIAGKLIYNHGVSIYGEFEVSAGGYGEQARYTMNIVTRHN